MLFLGNK